MDERVMKGEALIHALMTPEQEEKFVRELYDNFPEAASGKTPWCVAHAYDAFDFKFEDDEGKVHRITLKEAIRGFRLCVVDVLEGKLPGLDLTAKFLSDSGDWDGYAIHTMMQYAIYGKAIYG